MQIIIYVSGGYVQEVRASEDGVDVEIWDQDNINWRGQDEDWQDPDGQTPDYDSPEIRKKYPWKVW